MSDEINFIQVITPPNECARHGKDHMLVALHKRSNVPHVNGVPMGEGDPYYACEACLLGQIDQLRERLRTTAQILIGAVGAEGPMDAEDAARRAVAEVDRLDRWKGEALRVEREWNIQALAKMLGAAPGDHCRRFIGKMVPQLIRERDEALAENERLRKTLTVIECETKCEDAAGWARAALAGKGEEGEPCFVPAGRVEAVGIARNCAGTGWYRCAECAQYDAAAAEAVWRSR
ncbi:MAG: hypothetical protein WC683_01745 [bacterium]